MTAGARAARDAKRRRQKDGSISDEFLAGIVDEVFLPWSPPPARS
jgi:hypothetical protein